MRSIDLNADLGEGFGPWTMGDDAAMLGIVTSANVACGGHASDPETMFRTLAMARDRGISIGAHPSYPDKEGFGRRRLPSSPGEIERFVAAQTGALMAIAALAGARVGYVKPHGALGNFAAENADAAHAIVRAVGSIDASLAILAISGTTLETVARDAGLTVFSEIFADRGYTPSGHLVPRGQPGAMITDADAAARRLLGFLSSGQMPTVDGGSIALAVDSVCIHGDSAHAVAMAAHIRAAFVDAGIAVAPFLPVAPVPARRQSAA